MAVFDYGPLNDLNSGFQVSFASRMHNGDENPSEIYYANGGELNPVSYTHLDVYKRQVLFMIIPRQP